MHAVALINFGVYIISEEGNKTGNHRVEFLQGHLGHFRGHQKSRSSAKWRNLVWGIFHSTPLYDTWCIPFLGSEIPFLRSKFEFDLYWPSKIQYGVCIEVKYGVWEAHGVLIIFHTLWLLWSSLMIISYFKRLTKQEILGLNFCKVV